MSLLFISSGNWGGKRQFVLGMYTYRDKELQFREYVMKTWYITGIISIKTCHKMNKIQSPLVKTLSLSIWNNKS